MNFWQRLGGENAITLRAWLLLAPISIFLTVAFVPEGPRGSYLLWMLVGTLAHLATGAVLLIAKLSLLSSKPRAARPVAALLTFALAGVARGATVSLSSEYLALVESAEYLLRMRSGAVLSVFWFALAAIIIDASQKYRAAFLGLQDRLAETAELEQEARSAVKTYREQIINRVESIITAAFQNTQNLSQLRSVIDAVVRPLSHELYTKDEYPDLQAKLRQAQTQRRRIGIGSTIKTMFSVTAFNAKPVALVAIGGTAASRLWTAEPVSFLLDVLLNVIWILFALELAQRLTTNRPALRAAISVPVWLTVGILSGMITELTGTGTIFQNPGTLALLAFNVVAVCAFAAALFAYEFQREQKLAELSNALDRASWLRAKAKQALWSERRRLARIIHSEVQGRILATASRIGRSGDSEAVSKQQLDQLSDDCYFAMLATENLESLAGFLRDIREIWEGAVVIDSDAPKGVLDQLAKDPIASIATLEVIREAINNAVKHSKPQRIEITLELDPGLDLEATFLNLTVTNDGATKSKNSSSGLGSDLLDEVTSSWRLDLSENQARLWASIPLNLASPTPQPPERDR